MVASWFDVILVSALTILVFVAFLREAWPADIVALGAGAALVAAGTLTPGEALSVFSNPAPITVASMFVLSAALERTGVVDAAGQFAERAAAGSRRRGYVGLLLVAVVASAFMNNTPVVVMLTPIAIHLAGALRTSPSKLLIPVSYAAIFGGTCTLIGTSTNLVVDGAAQRLGQPAFGVFEIAGFGAAMAAIGLVYLLLVGYRLLPDRETVATLLSGVRPRQYLTETVVPMGSSLVGKTLGEAKLANLSGGRVVDVIRADASLRRELREVVLQPGDRILIKTEASGLMGLRRRDDLAFDLREALQEVGSRGAVMLEGIIGPRSRFRHHRLSEFNLRRHYGVYILAVHRQGENLRDKFDQVRLQVGDVILLEGPAEGVRRILDDEDLIGLSEMAGKAPRTAKAPFALGVIAAVVGLAAFDVMPIAALAFIGAVAVVAVGALDSDEAYGAIEWNILFLIFGMLMLGAALEKVGLAAAIANFAVQFAAPYGPIVVLSLVYLATSALTEIVSNNAVAVLLTPLVIGIADGMGLDARPFLVAVMFGASASFATPIGYQTNTFVYGAGGYRYTDFVRIGLPLNLLFWVAATVLIPFFWPFAPA